MSSSVSTSTLN